MHLRVCHSLRVALVLVLFSAWLSGCRGESERREPDRTIVVRDATQAAPAERQYDMVGRLPDRIEVVVSDPRGDTATVGPSPLAALTGRRVKVQFRRDLLGQSAAAPIPPTAQGPGGRAVHLAGTVRSAAGGWLVIEDGANTYWVPQAAILVIEAADVPSTVPSTN